MDAQKILEYIRQSENYHEQIVHTEELPAKEASFAELNENLHPHLENYLKDKGITKLFTHQVTAIEKVAQGQNVVVVTPTASGKTMCYNLPVLNHILNNPKGRALYIFPSKSLSQDQMAAVEDFNTEVKVAVYDGDTPDDLKPELREKTSIIITNPDMIHQGILPNHLKWHNFFSNLKYIVIDELHSYRGVFGTHVGHIIRRLRRICEHYGSKPQFIMCSATIANPKQHAERLTGLPVSLIDNNGAPQGAKKFVLWRPPSKRPYIQDVIWLFSLLIALRTRTITFSRARQTTERILRHTKKLLQEKLPHKNLHNKVVSYRGGYLARERRAIEEALFKGTVYGVVSTNALELGIDVGELEACIIAGYPGTIASTWQQAGRVGRRHKDSLVIFIAVQNPLDQYFIRKKEALFTKPTEQALVAPDNPYILLGHVLCAAHELPIKPQDFSLWGEIFPDLLYLLEEDGEIVQSEGSYYYIGGTYPASRVNIRSSSLASFQLKDKSAGNRLVGTLDGHRALSEAHPGAVYMHQGETYLVKDLDLENKHCYLNKVDVDYYTMVKRDKETEIIEINKKRPLLTHMLYSGNLKVTTRVTGYIKKHEATGQVLGGGELDLPEEILETQGMWVTFDPTVIEEAKGYYLNLMGGLHALEHASIGLLPLFAMCDRNDIGGLSIVAHPQTGLPTVFIHDAYDGGVGFSETAYSCFEDLLEKTLEAIKECECEDGCPNCIYSPKCSNFNRPLDKEAAIYLLHRLLGKEYTPRVENNKIIINSTALKNSLKRFK